MDVYECPDRFFARLIAASNRFGIASLIGRRFGTSTFSKDILVTTSSNSIIASNRDLDGLAMRVSDWTATRSVSVSRKTLKVRSVFMIGISWIRLEMFENVCNHRLNHTRIPGTISQCLCIAFRRKRIDPNTPAKISRQSIQRRLPCRRAMKKPPRPPKPPDRIDLPPTPKPYDKDHYVIGHWQWRRAKQKWIWIPGHWSK